VQRRGDQLAGDPRVDGRAVGRDLGRDCAPAQRPGEEAPGGRQVTPHGQQDVNDLAMLIDRPVEIGPLAGDLQVGLIDERPVARSVPARPGSLREIRRRCQASSVPGVTSRWARSTAGSGRASVARTARSAQSGSGRAT
jgi:hypothetical protein